MSRFSHITILGGGPAGLAVGYYCKKNGIPFTIYEAGEQIGGNAVTFRYEDFFFDSGAHRFHDKETDITEEMKKLLGKDLRRINVPTQIYYHGKFVDFPLSPLNLMLNLGLLAFTKATFEVVGSRLRTATLGNGEINSSFESFALNTYGRKISECFLLNFSEKLWGAPCSELSQIIAGTRMKGLNLKTFLMESVFGSKLKTEHLEGTSFYYPKNGIGVITKKLGEFCGEENILTKSEITKILHDNRRVQAIEVNGREKIDTDEVVSTLPLNHFLQMMEPVPPGEISLLTKSLRYRNMILVAIFLDRESVTKAATVYFPDRDLPFTRVYESRNRSKYMSPEGKTSLVAEIPCQQEDKLWGLKDDELIRMIGSHLVRMNWIKEEEITGATVNRLNHAYPILEIGFEEKINKINAFLGGFSNLELSGRNGKFEYAWIHNMMKYGKVIIEEYISKYETMQK